MEPTCTPAPDLSSPAEVAQYAATLDCIHCGLCLNTCPTYRLTGRESSSPRGRVHLMRAAAEERQALDADFAEEMDFCLVCRNCESVCPAGVRFGEMMETTRNELERVRPRGWPARLARRIGFGWILPGRGALYLVAASTRLLQVMRLAEPVAGLLTKLGLPIAQGLASLPPIPKASERRPLPAFTPARGEQRTHAAVLEGCVMPVLFGRVNRATVESLTNLGCACSTAPGHVCCGALHAHNGDLAGARDLARGTIAAFDALESESGKPLPVVVNSAGCGAHMKDYRRLLANDAAWAERAASFSERVLDYSELALGLVVAGEVQLSVPSGTFPQPVTWDAPCHLCHGQGIRIEPLSLLTSIEGLEFVPLADSESCCGSAGIYSALRPADSQAVLGERLEALVSTGARTLVTANPGCHLQWQAGVRRAGIDVLVLHLAELLAPASKR